MIHIFLLFFLLVSLVLNYVLLYTTPIIGIFTSSITILIYLLIAVYDFYDTEAQDIFSLCVTFILLNLITIYFHFSGLYFNNVITYLILFFISLLFCLKIFHKQGYFSFKKSKHLYIILPVGVLVAYVIYRFVGFSQFSVSHLSLVESFGLITLIGISEEIFFRALIQNAVTKMTDTFVAITFSSILYGLFHFSNNIFYVLVFMILSIIYCVIYKIWKNIYITIGLNILINATFYLLASHLLIFAVT